MSTLLRWLLRWLPDRPLERVPEPEDRIFALRTRIHCGYY